LIFFAVSRRIVDERNNASASHSQLLSQIGQKNYIAKELL
jgi:hypothetical protein